MAQPSLLPSGAQSENFAGFSYHLDGGLVPALTVQLSPGAGIYFEHHILLWKSTSVAVGIKKLRGVFSRFMSGMPIFMTEASGSGAISFSRDGVGQVFPIHLARGQELDVREHQFMAATNSVSYDFQMVRGVANILLGASGFFIDKFTASDGDGIVWLYGYGNVFEINLAPGEQIDVEPSAWLYKDPTVRLDTTVTNLSTGLLGGTSFTLNRFTGPGRLGLQSMSLPPGTNASNSDVASVATSSNTLENAGIAGLAAAAFNLFGKN